MEPGKHGWKDYHDAIAYLLDLINCWSNLCRCQQFLETGGMSVFGHPWWMKHQLFNREIADANGFDFTTGQDLLHLGPGFIEKRALNGLIGSIWVLQPPAIRCRVDQFCSGKSTGRWSCAYAHKQSPEASVSSTVIHPIRKEGIANKVTNEVVVIQLGIRQTFLDGLFDFHPAWMVPAVYGHNKSGGKLVKNSLAYIRELCGHKNIFATDAGLANCSTHGVLGSL